MSDLIHAKVGTRLAGTEGERARILRNQGSTLYDIHLIHYFWITVGAVEVADFAAMGLSTRKDDQVNDATIISRVDLTAEEGIFGVVSLNIDLLTEGGSAVVGAHTIPFPEPYTVPWLAVLLHADTVQEVHLGVDLWFTRRDADPMEKASLVGRLGGGRARTQ